MSILECLMKSVIPDPWVHLVDRLIIMKGEQNTLCGTTYVFRAQGFLTDIWDQNTMVSNIREICALTPLPIFCKKAMRNALALLKEKCANMHDNQVGTGEVSNVGSDPDNCYDMCWVNSCTMDAYAECEYKIEKTELFYPCS